MEFSLKKIRLPSQRWGALEHIFQKTSVSKQNFQALVFLKKEFSWIIAGISVSTLMQLIILIITAFICLKYKNSNILCKYPITSITQSSVLYSVLKHSGPQVKNKTYVKYEI